LLKGEEQAVLLQRGNKQGEGPFGSQRALAESAISGDESEKWDLVQMLLSSFLSLSLSLSLFIGGHHASFFKEGFFF
jgi:hypothetical protein